MIIWANFFLTIATGLIIFFVTFLPLILLYFFWYKPRRFRELAIEEMENNPILKREVMKDAKSKEYKTKFKPRFWFRRRDRGTKTKTSQDRDREHKPEDRPSVEKPDSDSPGTFIQDGFNDRDNEQAWPSFG